ncbi:ATP-dependent DNA ligase [Streptomyces sp. NBC_01462]|nr:ATP-dependent DNA ligase [Streptomyces sp. NBC_01462]
MQLVAPTVVAEPAVDVPLDASGRWHHPVRLMRVRIDLAPAEIPQFGAEA